MRYERDEAGVRDAQENLRDAQDEMAIAALEKQIKLIEDQIKAIEKQKKALSDQQEELQKAMEATSKYYEKLIKEQEKMFDDMIKALENTKSKWEELAEVDEISKAWSLVAAEMEGTGYTVEDVLNDVPGAFETFKDKYISFLSEMHNKDQGYLDGLKEYTDGYSQVAQKATETQTPIDNLGAAADTAAGKVSTLGSTASTAATGVSDLKDASEGISDNFDDLNNVDIQDFVDNKLGNLEAKLTLLKDLINGESSIKSAFEEINGLNFDEIIASFDSLVSAISSVITLLCGGGDDEGIFGGAGRNGKNGMPSNIPASATQTSSGSNLVTAISSVKESAIQNIGANSEEESDNTIGTFVALRNAVDNVATAIGMGDEKGTIGKNEKGGTLTAAITSLLPTTSDALRGGAGGEGVISMFQEFQGVVQEIVGLVNELVGALQSLSSIKLPSFEGMTFNGGGHYSLISLGEAMGTAHYEGTAKLSGDWGTKNAEKNVLVGELGQELMVTPDGKFRTIGDKGPEFIDVPKNAIIFNHKQTEELLSKGNLVLPRKGRSFANGTLPDGFSSFSFSDSYASFMSKIKEADIPTMSGIKMAIGDLKRDLRTELQSLTKGATSTSTTTVNQSNTFNVSGVTGEEVAQKINSTLVQTFSGMSLNAYQRSMA